jgi:hypothetical protein
MTTMGYVAGSDNQASLNVSSAAGFLGAVARVLAGGARKLFSLKAFRAARRRTALAAKLMAAAFGLACGLAANEFEVLLRRHNGRAGPCAGSFHTGSSRLDNT